MKFIDLFSGLGGFHVALSRLGHDCVFASEIDESLARLYQQNFGVLPAGDIREVDEKIVPKHDILCAGFPCQPFSKAGDQKGLRCTKWGDLFKHVMRIVRRHKPKYVLLENVPNLPKHNSGNTWSGMERQLRRAGYDVRIKILSPHKFGIPQIRDRVFIVARLGKLDHFEWPTEQPATNLSISSVLDENPTGARQLSAQVKKCLEVWQDFIDRFPANEELPSYPIWSMEFGATYPYERSTPHSTGPHRLKKFLGSHGSELAKVSPKERLALLPSHARDERKEFPDWKIDFIKKNRELYHRHKRWIDEWLPSILSFPSSLQKLEWNCKGEPRNIWKYVIQFRASGVRIKRPTTAPALVAMTDTQVPIIAWEKRYMTPRECARLQSLHELKHLPSSNGDAYHALGNSVNADVVERVARCLTAEPIIPPIRAIIPVTSMNGRAKRVIDGSLAVLAQVQHEAV